MTKPHFFKAKSRIGLLNAPIGKQELNIGVELGPDAILNQQFLDAIENPPVEDFGYPQPEEIKPEEFNQVLAASNKALIDLIDQKLAPTETQVVIGGDHSVTFASINAVLKRIENPEELGYIQIDSHGDMHTFASSPTKNFHGMYLRPYLSDDFDIAEIKQLITKHLAADQMWFIGNLDLDPGEKEFFFDVAKIKNTNLEGLRQNNTEFLSQLKNFVVSHKYLHVSLDIDGLDGSIAPATGLPAANGLLMSDLEPILKEISTHQNLSFDLVEVNPTRAGAEATVHLAQKILRIVCQKNIETQDQIGTTNPIEPSTTPITI